MFRTIVAIEPSEHKITYENKLMTFGSCFSENIGQRLQNAYFQVDTNPFGVLFNPASIHTSLQLLLEKRIFTEQDLFQHGSLWSSFYHSTAFSCIDQQACLTTINQRIESAIEAIQQADFLLLTLGTSWIYQSKSTGEIVANCHKLPADNFTRKRLTVDEIVAMYSPLMEQLHQLNPKLQFIFTVSPIRHWKDGAQENNLSKGILQLAIEALKKRFHFIAYFPAFEIQMDELRDYRFYAADMLHPSDTAIDYIWKRFSDVYFSTETQGIVNELEALNAQLNHRPINPDSQEHNNFLERLIAKKKDLRSRYPMINI